MYIGVVGVQKVAGSGWDKPMTLSYPTIPYAVEYFLLFICKQCF